MLKRNAFQTFPFLSVYIYTRYYVLRPFEVSTKTMISFTKQKEKLKKKSWTQFFQEMFFRMYTKDFLRAHAKHTC